MANRIASIIRQARSEVYSSLPEDFRAFSALVRIAQHAGVEIHRPGRGRRARMTRRRVKKAYDKKDITRGVNQLLKRERVDQQLLDAGMPPLPDVDWGWVIVMNARKFARYSHVDTEEFIAELFSDMIAGSRLNTLRDYGPLKHNIVKQLKEWGMEGKGKRDIERLLATWTQRMAKAMLNTEAARARTLDDRSIGYDSVNAPGEQEEMRGQIFDDIFQLGGGATTDMMNMWHSMQPGSDPIWRDLLRRINDFFEEYGEEYGLIWSVYMRNPKANMPEILNEEVIWEGERQTLAEVLGFKMETLRDQRNSMSKLRYRLNKMFDLVKKRFPDLKKWKPIKP